MPNDGACAFCAYLQGERSYTILWRDQISATFVTREQRGEPHVLVLPIRHVETVLDLSDEEAQVLALAVRRAAKAIDTAYKKQGIAVWQNNGTPAGQAISHVHFHVAGTLEQGGTNWGEVPELAISETEIIACRLRNSPSENAANQ